MHPTQFRYTGQADPSAPGGIAEIYRALIADEARLGQIIADVLAAHTDGANILVLTTWIDHLNAIAGRLRAAGKPVVVLSGQMRRGSAVRSPNNSPTRPQIPNPC